MKFSVSLASKIGQNQSMLRNPPLNGPPGENHFDTGVPHDFVPPPQISWIYHSDWKSYGHLSFTSLISPNSPPQPTWAITSICAWWVLHQHIIGLGGITSQFLQNNISKILTTIYTLEYQRSQFCISTTFPYHPLVGPWCDRQGKKCHGLDHQVLITFLTLLQCILNGYNLT